MPQLASSPREVEVRSAVEQIAAFAPSTSRESVTELGWRKEYSPRGLPDTARNAAISMKPD